MKSTRRTPITYLCSLLLILLPVGLYSHAAERCVLLKNGNVLVGETQQLAEDVVVQTKTSQVRLPVGDVELVANSLAKVYEYKSRKASNRPHARDALVRWCLSHDLVAEARQEFVGLQRSSPKYPRLAVLRQKLLQQNHQHAPKAGTTTLPNSSPLHPDLQYAIDRRDQLSKDSMRDFVRIVQPILVNGCALAGCHGKAPKSTYQLLSSRSTMTQGLTHRNLGATLQRISRPAQHSLLWLSATNQHGGMQLGLAEQEQAKLFQWLRRASSELDGGATRDFQVQQASAVFAADGSDPFDPAEFNSLPGSIQQQSQ